MTLPLSVIIPVYNVEPYLRPSLDSVVYQTLRDIEIICIDDGSTDLSGEILDEYAARDERFIVIHQANARQAAARNRGLEIARGEYIAFLDADDRFMPEAFEQAWSKATETDADIVRFYFHYEPFNDRYPLPPQELGEGDAADSTVMLRTLFEPGGPNVWSKLWKSAFLKERQIRFSDDLAPLEDFQFCAYAALFQPKLIILNEDLYVYTQRPDSSMGRQGQSLAGVETLVRAADRSIADWQAAVNNADALNYLYLKKFEYIYANYLLRYLGRPSERDFLEYCCGHFDEENRSRFFTVRPQLEPGARLFFTLLFGFPKIVRRCRRPALLFCFHVLYPLARSFYSYLPSRKK